MAFTGLLDLGLDDLCIWSCLRTNFFLSLQCLATLRCYLVKVSFFFLRIFLISALLKINIEYFPMSISSEIQWPCPYFSFTTSFQKVLPHVYKDKDISALWSMHLQVLLTCSESLTLSPLGLFFSFLFLGKKPKPKQSKRTKPKQQTNKWTPPPTSKPNPQF